MTNRNKIKQWFITFPQWEGTRQSILDALQQKYELSYYKIAQELHKDGNTHFHALIQLELGITKVNILKNLSKQFPKRCERIHVRAVRSMNASITYLDKEDKECLEHADGYTRKKGCLQKKYIATLLMWAQFCGYDTIEEYSEHLKQKLENNDQNCKII